MRRRTVSYCEKFCPSPIRHTQLTKPSYRLSSVFRSGRSGLPTSLCRYGEWHLWQRKRQFEIEIVRLSSSGTSTRVIAVPTYFRSFIIDIFDNVASAAYAIAVSGSYVVSGDPFAAKIASICGADGSGEATGADQLFLVRRRI